MMKIVPAVAILLMVGLGVRIHTADAHGAMNLPRSRNMGRSGAGPSASGGSVNEAGCEEGACMWFNQGW